MKENLKSFANLYAKNALLINCCILMAFTICSLFSEVFGVLCFVAFTLISIFSSEENGFYYLMFLAPFSATSMFLGEREIIYYSMVCAFLLSLLVRGLFKKSLLIKKPTLIVFLSLVLYLFLPFGNYNINKFISIGTLIMIIVGVYFMYCFRDKIDFYKMAKLGLLSLVLSIFVATVVGYISDGGLLYNVDPFVFGVRFGAMFRNINYFSEYCIVLASVFAYFIFTKERKIMPIIMFLITLGLGLLSLSKSYAVLCALLVVLVFICAIIYGYQKQYKKNFYVIVVLGLGAVVICAIVFMNRMGDFLSLFDMESLTTNRNVIWIKCLQDVSASVFVMLFGCGMSYRLTPTFYYPTAHNFYLEFFTKLGIIGFSILVALIILLIKNAKDSTLKIATKKCFAGWIAPIILMTYFLVESFVFNMACFILIPLTFIFPVIVTEQCGKLMQNADSEGCVVGQDKIESVKDNGGKMKDGDAQTVIIEGQEDKIANNSECKN